MNKVTKYHLRQYAEIAALSLTDNPRDVFGYTALKSEMEEMAGFELTRHQVLRGAKYAGLVPVEAWKLP